MSQRADVRGVWLKGGQFHSWQCGFAGEADVGCHEISSVSQLHSVVSVGRTDIGLNDKKPERSSREVQVLLFRCYLRERLCLGCK